MPNNIINLQEAIAQRNAENAAMAAETFEQGELTQEEREKMEELANKVETVVTETTPEGTSSSVPLDAYMAGIDSEIKQIKDAAGNFVAKGLNVGDIKKTAEEMKRDGQRQAIKAFRDMALETAEDSSYTDDDIIAINNRAIEKIQQYMKVDRLNSDDIIKTFRRLTLRQISEIVPAEFMDIYVRPNEVLANNLPAKERLLATLGYLSVTGPEMDYLNEYIDHENKLMMLSHKMIECSLNVTEVLQSKESLVDLIKQANALAPQNPNSPWSKYIKGGPNKVHSEFAQKAVVTKLLRDAYVQLQREYQDDPECVAEIQEQIDESDQKYLIYTRITNLDLMRELWGILKDRLRDNKKMNYQGLQREAIAAMDRIRRAKQNVSFPIYADGKPGNNRPEVLFKMYMDQYPSLLAACNTTIKAVREKDPDGVVGIEDIQPIEIEGIPNEKVHEMFAMMLLILFGRIMKKLSPNDQTKYQAIELDMYFTMYCKLITDVYLMDEVWYMMMPFVKYAIETWPAPKGKGKKS
ncbi:MAG: hypothetical protein NC114_06455 [Ruminococcus flavefaciens]|nr:hypothetical protein [Ruminococcus flavefaciens]